MQTREGRGEPRSVFVDSSVFFAAVLSPTGGSFRIFREARARNIRLVVTPYVVAEVRRGLETRYPRLLRHFDSFFLHFPVAIIPDPPVRSVRQYIRFVPPEDAPILAAAIRAKAAYLVTLDKKHFLNPLKYTTLPVAVLAPGDFIREYFSP